MTLDELLTIVEHGLHDKITSRKINSNGGLIAGITSQWENDGVRASFSIIIPSPHLLFENLYFVPRVKFEWSYHIDVRFQDPQLLPRNKWHVEIEGADVDVNQREGFIRFRRRSRCGIELKPKGGQLKVASHDELLTALADKAFDCIKQDVDYIFSSLAEQLQYPKENIEIMRRRGW